MKLKVLASVFTLAFASLACAMPDVASLFNPLPKDDFSTTGKWGTGTDSNSSVEYENDALRMQVFEPLYMTWSTPGYDWYDNTHMEVDVTSKSSDDQVLYGFICNSRGTTMQFYFVGVSPMGGYAFSKSEMIKGNSVLKQGTSDLITNSGETIRLGLDCGANSMTLYVNGEMVDSVSDSTYVEGQVGLFVANDTNPNGGDVIFDNFVMTKLK